MGKVYGITEVLINGKVIGTRWYGRHCYPLSGAARQGDNEIKIILTTTLYNYCRTREENPEIRRWLRTREPEPSGIIGPVRIYAADK